MCYFHHPININIALFYQYCLRLSIQYQISRHILTPRIAVMILNWILFLKFVAVPAMAKLCVRAFSFTISTALLTTIMYHSKPLRFSYNWIILCTPPIKMISSNPPNPSNNF